MKFWQRYWYYIGGVAFVILTFAMGLGGSAALDYVQVLLIFSWMGMLVHQFEEYAWPGGFPLISNMIVFNEIERPDRYILNQRQCFVSNVVLCYLCYIVPIFFPQLIWLAAAQIFQGLWQIPAHGIVLNMRLKSKYNPGLFAAVFLQLPVAIVFIWYVLTFMPEPLISFGGASPVRSCCWASRSACRSSSCMTAILRIRSKSESFGVTSASTLRRFGKSARLPQRQIPAAFRRVSSAKRRKRSRKASRQMASNFAKKLDRWCDNQWIVFLCVTATVVAVLAAKDVPLRRPLQIYFASGCAAMAVVLALHFAGIVAPDLTSERMGALRGTYGYGHPNTFGGLVFGLVLAYALLRAQKVRWVDCLLVFAVGVFLLVGPASRSAALCTLALAVGLVFCRLRAGHSVPRWWPGTCAGMVGLTAAVSYLLPLLVIKVGPWNNDIGPAWLAKLDSLLTCRISLTWMAYRLLDVKIAGQVFNWPTVDNSFAFALFQFGPVVAALLGILFAAALWGHAKQGRRVEVYCLFAMLAYAYMEVQPFHLTTNPTALLLCGAVFAQTSARWQKIE